MNKTKKNYIWFLLFVLCVLLSSKNANAQVKVAELSHLVKYPTQSTGKKPAVLFILHGYGSDEHNLFSLANHLNKTMLVVSLRAPKPQAGSGYKWYDLKFGNKSIQHDPKEVTKLKPELLTQLLLLCNKYGADTSQIYLMGFSQGAYLSLDMAITYYGKIKGVVALSGGLMAETKKGIAALQLPALNVFMSHGIQDEVIGINYADQDADFLVKHKAAIIYKRYNMQHEINGMVMSDFSQWLNAKVK